MNWVVLIIVTLALVLGLGLLIFSLARRSKDVVPDVADRQAARHDRVVAVDEHDAPVLESQEGAEVPPRDDAGFENVLKDQLDDVRS